MTDYDEDLHANPVFVALQRAHAASFSAPDTHVFVPRSGSFRVDHLKDHHIAAHILVPVPSDGASERQQEQQTTASESEGQEERREPERTRLLISRGSNAVSRSTTSGRRRGSVTKDGPSDTALPTRVRVDGKRLLVLDPRDDGNIARTCNVLFDETFYTDNDKAYVVHCIDKPIAGPVVDVEEPTQPLRSYDECLALLVDLPGGKFGPRAEARMTAWLNSIRQTLTLEEGMERVRAAYADVLRLTQRDSALRKHARKGQQHITNIRVALETILSSRVHDAMFARFINVHAQEDATLNRVCRNLVAVEPEHLGLDAAFAQAANDAVRTMRGFAAANTPLQKLQALHHAVHVLLTSSQASVAMGADDLIPALCVVVVRSEISHWHAHLAFITEMTGLSNSLSEEDTYYLTSLEAAVAHVAAIDVTDDKYFQWRPEKGDDAIAPLYFAVCADDLEAVRKRLAVAPCAAKQRLGGRRRSSTASSTASSSTGTPAQQPTHPPTHQPTQEVDSTGHSSARATWVATQAEDAATTVTTAGEGSYAGAANSHGAGEGRRGRLGSTGCHPLCTCPRCKPVTDVADVQDARGRTPLHIAAHLGRNVILQYLLRSSKTSQVFDNKHATPLHLACARNQATATLLLLETSDVNVTDRQGNTPLHVCADKGHLQAAKALMMSSKPRVNARNNRGDTALHLASHWGYDELVQQLLQFSADISAQNRRQQAPHDVAHGKATRRVLERYRSTATPTVISGPPIVSPTSSAMASSSATVAVHTANKRPPPPVDTQSLPARGSAAHIASTRTAGEGAGSADAVQRRARATSQYGNGGADGAVGDREALLQQRHSYHAAIFGLDEDDDDFEEDMSKLSAGSKSARGSVALQPSTGGGDLAPSMPPLSRTNSIHASQEHLLGDDKQRWLDLVFEAIEQGEVDLVKYRLRLEPDDDNPFAQDKCHPLCQCERCSRVIRSPPEIPLTINSHNTDGFTPLLVAVRYGQADVAELLLEHGADIGMRARQGLTALHFACQYNHQRIAEALLRAGMEANVHRGDAGVTPLHLAAANGHTACARILLRAGANVNETDEKGNAPLHNACRWGHREFVATLLQAGANAHIANVNDKTPLEECRNATIRSMLQQAHQYRNPNRFALSGMPAHLKHLEGVYIRAGQLVGEAVTALGDPVTFPVFKLQRDIDHEQGGDRGSNGVGERDTRQADQDTADAEEAEGVGSAAPCDENDVFVYFHAATQSWCVSQSLGTEDAMLFIRRPVPHPMHLRGPWTICVPDPDTSNKAARQPSNNIVLTALPPPP